MRIENIGVVAEELSLLLHQSQTSLNLINNISEIIFLYVPVQSMAIAAYGAVMVAVNGRGAHQK